MDHTKKNVRIALVSLGLAAFGLTFANDSHVGVSGQETANAADEARRTRLTAAATPLDNEGGLPTLTDVSRLTEALAAFDNVTNGFDVQGPPFDTIEEDNVHPLASFNDNRFVFEEVEKTADGLGPTYNAQSCRECHQNVATGGASQITEQRTGHLTGGQFFDSQGGSLIASRATHPDAMELVSDGDNIRTFRISTNVLGAGYIESISNSVLLALRDAQPASMRGLAVTIPVLEANNRSRVGRFGWKSQHGSLESFSADAYLNEMGITSPLFQEENSSGGRPVTPWDTVADPEDDGVDLKAFANFMRSTKAPPRGAITAAVRAGEQTFIRIGCATCHIPALITARPGTVVNGGALTVPASLGNKIIHPYSDFLLHDIGSGDGIPIQPTPEFTPTANKIRTAPLWALRTRNRLMHDGLSFTRDEAILRHGGQAATVTSRYRALSNTDKASLVTFLNSL
jgi:CxxC motif-containing protein (DUF1111 family)